MACRRRQGSVLCCAFIALATTVMKPSLASWFGSPLCKRCIEVPQPVAVQNSGLIQLTTHADLQSHWVVLFHSIEGYEPHSEQNLQASFRRRGAINARLHTHARTLPPPTGIQRLTWATQGVVGSNAYWGHWKHARHLQRNHWSLIGQVVGDIEKRLSKYSQQASRFGLIHADLRLANLLVDGELSRIIDFDDCGFGWYLHDLVSAPSFHEDHVATPRSIESWLAGYTTPQNACL